MQGVQAVVHLAGAGVGDHRWTDEYKKTIRDSRVVGTTTLTSAIVQLEQAPEVFISGSAQGFYGDRADEELDETAARGTGFLADVTAEWEAAAAPAAAAGIRVVHPRTGLVMSAHGGAFARLLPLAKWGVAGPLGSGRQWWSWITLADQVSALEHLLTSDLAGPVNFCAPEPATNREVTSAIARELNRPAILPAPAFALRLALGEFASEITSSTRMIPARLENSGYVFRHADLISASRWLTGKQVP
jgi:uncharacterized protein (TIGR01777 family)